MLSNEGTDSIQVRNVYELNKMTFE